MHAIRAGTRVAMLGHVLGVYQNMLSLPRWHVAFSRLSIDLIEQMTPVSARGHRYALPCVDVATRYPFAIPLKGASAEEVVEALVGWGGGGGL